MTENNGTDLLDMVDDLNREIGRAEAIFAAMQGMAMQSPARGGVIATLQSDLVARLNEINKRFDALRTPAAAG